MLKCEPSVYHALHLCKLDSCDLFCSKEPGRQKRSVRGGRLQQHYDFVVTAQRDEIDEPTPLNLISILLPNVLVKGGDWTKEETVGWETVERTGGEVVILSFVKGASTSRIIETILRHYEKGR